MNCCKTIFLKYNFFFLITLVLPLLLEAQQVQFSNFGVKEGLPVSKVNEIEQASDGKIWVATGVGVSIFNGESFTNFSPDDGLNQQGVSSLEVLKNGSVWCGHYEGGLSRGNEKGFSELYFEQLKIEGDITALFEDSNANIWIGTTQQGAIQVSDVLSDTLSPSAYIQFSDEAGVESLVVDIKQLGDSIYVLTDQGIRVKSLEDSRFSPYQVKGVSVFRKFASMAVSQDGLLILGDTKGNIYLLNANRDLLSSFRLPNNSDPIYAITADRANGCWAGTGTGALYHLDFSSGVDKCFNKECGFLSSGIKTLAIDRENNLIIGSYATGLFIFKGDAFQLYSVQNGMPGQRIEALAEQADGTLWFAGYNGVSSMDTDGVVTQFTPENRGISSGKVRLLSCDSEQGIWAVANSHDVFYKKQGAKKFKLISDFDNLFSGMDKILAIHATASEKVWFGFLSGVIFYDLETQTAKRLYHRNQLAGIMVSSLLSTPKGSYFGTQGEGVWFSEDGVNFLQILDAISVNTMAQVAPNTLMIGTGIHGILVLENQIVIDTIDKKDEAILSDYITAICASKEAIIIGTGIGLNVIDRVTGEVFQFTLGNQFLGGEVSINAALFDRNQRFWMGTAFGAVSYLYSPDAINLLPPELTISRLRVNLEEVPLVDGEKFLYNHNNFRFNFSGICIKNPLAVKYRSRLKGLEAEWSQASSLTEVAYTNLPFGTYCFEVNACNNQNIWLKNPVSYTFEITPPFYLRWYFILTAILLFIALTVLFIRVRERNLKRERQVLKEKVAERTQEIAQQNVKLEEMNRDITDSINYAKRIQSSVMRPEQDLKRLVAKSFIYYRPRDIVSGDFYWFSDKHDLSVIAAADCTGHGVPGAFMSMIGISHLNEIVNEKKTLNPAKILNQLRADVISVLRQSSEGDTAKDGMDIALAVIDKTTNRLAFSGAYNSCYIVRKGLDKQSFEEVDSIKIFNEMLFELKGDRMPVGYSIKNSTAFDYTEVELQKGDIFVLTTDGFIDQFGGDKGKKFMSRRFKEMLCQLHGKSTADRIAFVDQTFINWKGDLEQVDDVLVIVGEV